MNATKKKTAEYRISNRKISKEGFALLSHFIKKDRIPSFDLRYSIFSIRYSLLNFHKTTQRNQTG